METFVIQFIHGLVYGLLLFLVASGLTLVFGMMSVLNIAHVSFYMLGAYLSYTMFKVVGNFWLALIVCPILVAFLGILMERFILRRVHAAGHVQEFVITFGILFALTEGQQVREKHDGLLFLLVPNLHAPEQHGLLSLPRQPGKADDLVAHHVAVLRNLQFFLHLVHGLLLHPRHEVDFLLRQFPKPHVINVTAVQISGLTAEPNREGGSR